MKPETTETIGPILRALDGTASGELHGLPLAPDLYPASCRVAVVAEFSQLCRAEVTPGEGVDLLSLVVHDHLRSEAPRILGEFLNHLLVASIRDRLWPGR